MDATCTLARARSLPDPRGIHADLCSRLDRRDQYAALSAGPPGRHDHDPGVGDDKRWLRGSYDEVVALQQPYPAERMSVSGPVFPTREANGLIDVVAER